MYLRMVGMVMPTHTRQPNDIYRQSMAIYYMTEPKNDIEIEDQKHYLQTRRSTK